MGRLPGKANGINGSEAPPLRRKPGRWQAGRRKQGRWQAGRRRIRRGLLAFFLTLLILSAACEDFRPSTIDLAVASHRYSILTWELGNLPDKWLRKLGNLWPGRAGLPREERVAQAREFFALGQDLGQLKYQLRLAQAVKPPAGVSPSEAADEAADEATPKGPSDGPQEALSQAQGLTGQIEEIEEIEERRQALRPQAEALIEGELAAVLTREGITAPWGVPFPPVDAVFGGPPSLLVVSPRDRIYRQHTILLRPGLDHQVREGIEERLFRSENLSALVENTGGLAVYPSVVLDTAGMNYALTVTAHEWLHHWLFFQPLGRNLHKSPELLTLNETTASIAGEELGDLTFTALTGEVVNRAPAAAPAGSDSDSGSDSGSDSDSDSKSEPDPGRFDFTNEMRQTRRRAEKLLVEGKIEEAEAYMEERRQNFLANGYNIRKINQAYFAFHGSYATGPGSVSPIGEQLRELRRRSDSVSHFLETVSQFTSYQQFLEYLDYLEYLEYLERLEP